MTQLFVALKANAANLAADNGGGSYTLSLTVADESGVYNGMNVAAGMKLLKVGDGGTTGQMKLYDITAVANVFSLQLDVTVTDINTAGTPNFGDFAIVQPNAQGVFPIVAGVDPGLQQAITQYNLTVLESIGGASLYTADGIVQQDRIASLNGKTVTFKDGTTETLISASGLKVTGADIETDKRIITHSPNGSRWANTTNDIGAPVTTKLP